MDNETWKQITDFPLYAVSNTGRVKSLGRSYKRGEWRYNSQQTVEWSERILGGWIKRIRGKPAAVMVSLRRDGKTHIDRVHRLVLQEFVGPCPDGMEGCHNDGDPTNNHVSNLRWDSHKSNIADMVIHETKSEPPIHSGEAHHNARLTDAEILEIRSTKIERGVKAALARKYGVSQTTINRIVKGIQRPIDC